MNPIELSLFSSRLSAVCDEMGVLLQRSAFSPNIRDRLDYSCAVFDAQGGLCAQAAHIPVHLGSMAYAMADIVGEMSWEEGDQLIVNDPYLGGTHLPDVTVIAPVFVSDVVVGFVANRAHHADIGASSPGSMPLSRTLEEEGVLIPPQLIQVEGKVNEVLLARLTQATRNPTDAYGDFSAQLGCNRRGMERLIELVEQMSIAAFNEALIELNDYAERVAKRSLGTMPDGTFEFSDVMESDGQGAVDIPVQVRMEWRPKAEKPLLVDFSGSAGQVAGNINCPLSVTVAGVWYALRCLMPDTTPACLGAFRVVDLRVPEGSVLNAQRPAAVAAGNVETSTRVVDVMLGALARAFPYRVPAASQGTMNNMAFGADGGKPWGYYETMGGGMGGSECCDGVSARQSHMTNTRNTPVEVLEMRYPLRVQCYSLRRRSGGLGLHRGGDGLIREFEFLQPGKCTFLTERRRVAPWGLAGGNAAKPGEQRLNGESLPAKCEVDIAAGDRITVETPGGGGWGDPAAESGMEGAA
ncbi:MAG: hydantoinase B/oxoprolinase family protein [bacterium]